MLLKKVLVLYKRSAYRIYFLDKESSFEICNKQFMKKEIARFKKAHDEHYQTLKVVEAALKRHDINYEKYSRGADINYEKYSLVITVGGDGTFLETCRNIKSSFILGVNSALSYSVGKLCAANINNFEKLLKKILKKDFNPCIFPRLRMELNGTRKSVDFLNDILVAHSNPAAMSRYYIQIGKKKEEQRNSGIWIASPTGSSGAIHSAGGKRLDREEKKMQYMPRELYCGGIWRCDLRGGALGAKQSITLTSLMRNGTIYVDGSHLTFNFPFGAVIHVSFSPDSIKTIKV